MAYVTRPDGGYYDPMSGLSWYAGRGWVSAPPPAAPTAFSLPPSQAGPPGGAVSTAPQGPTAAPAPAAPVRSDPPGGAVSSAPQGPTGPVAYPAPAPTPPRSPGTNAPGGGTSVGGAPVQGGSWATRLGSRSPEGYEWVQLTDGRRGYAIPGGQVIDGGGKIIATGVTVTNAPDGGPTQVGRPVLVQTPPAAAPAAPAAEPAPAPVADVPAIAAAVAGAVQGIVGPPGTPTKVPDWRDEYRPWWERANDRYGTDTEVDALKASGPLTRATGTAYNEQDPLTRARLFWGDSIQAQSPLTVLADRTKEALPNPNRISPKAWLRMPRSTQDFFRSAYEDKGIDASDVEDQIAQNSPAAASKSAFGLWR